MKRSLVVLAMGATLMAAPLPAYAGNPSGTGQPSQSCGSATAPDNPPGFDSGGFANAEEHYAGNQPQSSKNPKSVSQYDVACYQISQH